AATGTSLTRMFGVGPVIAAAVIGDVRDVSRFPNRDHFAAYDGTAPIEVSSGPRKIYRLSRRGNRRHGHAALARDGAVVAEGLPGPAFARHMLSVDPPDHTRLRRLASAAFSRPRIAALRPRVQAIVDGLLDDLEARGEVVVDLVKGFAFPLPFTVISELLGVPGSDRD